MSEQPVHVAVAVIRNSSNEILIAKRPDHLHQGGLWEFPGGKVEQAENTDTALRREIEEELGLHVCDSVPLMSIYHQYPDKTVFLDVHEVRSFNGQPAGLEGQEIQWVPVNKLHHYCFPRANRNILNRLQLPQNYLITGEYSSIKEFEQRLKKALESGVRLVQYRDPALARTDYIKRARIALSVCHGYGAKLLLNTDATVLQNITADGIHFTSARLMQMKVGKISEEILYSASIHNARQLEQANKLELDFVVISPVLPTLSHPDARMLGWDNLKEMVRDANMPVYALGGMQKKHIKPALEAGAQGIAAIRSFWK